MSSLKRRTPAALWCNCGEAKTRLFMLPSWKLLRKRTSLFMSSPSVVVRVHGRSTRCSIMRIRDLALRWRSLSFNFAEAPVILERLLKEGPVDMALTANDAAEQVKPKQRRAAVGTAISEVWSGKEEGLAGFLGAALKENGIPVRVERHGQRAAVCTPPEDEGRAREIVREIVEGAPPE